MKETFLNLVTYLKKPVLESDPNTNIQYRFKLFFKLLIISILIGFIISPIYAFFSQLHLIDLEHHKVEEMFKNMSKYQILGIGAIFMPILEETIFRAPITLFKKPKAFKIAFYTFALLFGFMHITNFEITTNVLLLAPFLVLPQILLGACLGYIRIRFGLQWSMLLHAAYNGILFTIGFLT
ncbi:MAG: CPBP family intramembrane glutamic endopeptidase [Polaribacter sp.]